MAIAAEGRETIGVGKTVVGTARKIEEARNSLDYWEELRRTFAAG